MITNEPQTVLLDHVDMRMVTTDDESASLDRNSLVQLDPDHPGFLHPTNMVAAILEYCRETGQSAPDGPGGYTRAILESLAFKYRFVTDSLHELTGHTINEIQIVGGGSTISQVYKD